MYEPNAIDTLGVVNACLHSIGQGGLMSLEDEHPMKDDAVRLLNSVLISELSYGYWFNTEVVELLPDTEFGFIYIPTNALRVLVLGNRAGAVQRGRRMYNPCGNTFVHTKPVCVEMFVALAFEDLPPHAQTAAETLTVMRFQHSFDGDQQRYAQLTEMAIEARAELRAENIRQIKAYPLNREVQYRVTVIPYTGGAVVPSRRSPF